MSVRDAYQRLHDAFKGKDEAALRAAAAPDVEFVMPGMAVTGIDAYMEMARVWWNAFPDLDMTVRSVTVDGDTAVEEGVFRGTHTGAMPSPDGQLIPPTGRRVELAYADFFTVRDGVVQSDRLYMDRMAMLEQLGLIPAPGAAAPAG
ncbi:MAG TPA: ester cyclase [Candidatus Dormibacteraeota bacterium]|nr:ester cyclase [Candidatus Dormibacteraeota bacterium]